MRKFAGALRRERDKRKKSYPVLLPPSLFPPAITTASLIPMLASPRCNSRPSLITKVEITDQLALPVFPHLYAHF